MAAKFLVKNGYFVCNANFISNFGEIDIVAKDKEFICFVEVKLRSSIHFAYPVEFVTKAKQRKIIKTAYLYLQEKPSILQPRFDVIEILIFKYHKYKLKIRHIKNAFNPGELFEFC
jgi:putative endonuclease